MSVFGILELLFISLSADVVMRIYSLNTVKNHRFEGSDRFVINSFNGMSFCQCLFQCKIRPKCRALEYRYLVKYCRVLSEKTTIVKYAGYTIVYGTEDETIQCEGDTCQQNEVCDTDSMKCSIVECGYPDFFYTDLKGNIFRVGAKLGSNCPSFKEYICEPAGLWERKTQTKYSVLTCRDIREGDKDVQSGYYINNLGTSLYCDFDTDDGDWLVFQRRLDGSVDFYKTWEYYKSGFGNICGEFWLGLEHIYDILQQSSSEFELRVDLEDWEGITSYALYDYFSITDESDNYRLRIGNYTGNAGDSLDYHNGHQFSTKDRGDKSRCARRFTGAWWYNVCHKSNLNGFYYHSRIVPQDATGVSWFFWKNTHNYSLKTVSMKMREKRHSYD